ncbi:DNA cytosine methyltransferase [Streptomyces sp. NPDC085946]|uniref:DNA cytosine methyltransferase n=1 Tax=Streptomyces sp. NPDC085946 TaxID=3365744 RepID=UPI0037CD165C
MTSTEPHPSQPGQIRVMDLFAGAGGFSAGFAMYRPIRGKNPFVSVAAVEFDPAAASTYAANFGAAHVHAGDIANFDSTPFKGQVDVILGGPPCQGFSGLGNEDPDDPRNELWREYVNIVAKVHPKIFVIENVDRFLRSGQYRELEAASRQPGHPLHDYRVVTKVLNAADYGVPQARRRVIVICTHKDFGDPLRHPVPTHDRRGYEPSEEDPQGLLFPALSGREGGKPRWVPVSQIFEKSAKKVLWDQMPEPQDEESYIPGIPGFYRTGDLHFGRNPEPLSRARYMAIPENGNRNDLRGKYFKMDKGGNIWLSTDEEYDRVDGVPVYLSTESWDKHNKGSGDVMGRLRKSDPSVTIRTEFYKPEKGRYLHPEENRPITHYEAALIQGFPEGFKWYGSKIQIARQIGNAVPTGLAVKLAEAIHTFLSGRS